MHFKSISLINWRQFGNVDIQFDDRLTILTGANGSGKTTILNLLGRHYSWSVNFTGVPVRKPGGPLQYWADARMGKRNIEDQVEVGSIGYSNGAVTSIMIPAATGQQYNPTFPQVLQVPGIFMPSHRPLYSYQAVTTIPTQALSRSQAYNEYFGTILNRFLGGSTPKSPVQIMKETLISLAVFSQPGPHVVPDEAAAGVFDGFQRILKELLPPDIGFEKLLVQVPEVLLQTGTGTFPIDSASGGLSSLIDIAWRIFMFDPGGSEFVCSIDEPENHLHPAMQQSFLPNLLRAFPSVQFIICTHSPFMITAVPEAVVYVLNFNANGNVSSQKLDVVDKAGTADDVLREVLGLPFTMPLWAERKLEEIINRHIKMGVSEETVDLMDAELVQAGLAKYSSKATLRLVEELPEEE